MMRPMFQSEQRGKLGPAMAPNLPVSFVPLTDTFPLWQPVILRERPALSTQWSCKELHSIAAYRWRTRITTGC